MPNKFSQHEIRQRVVQTLFTYEIQTETNLKVLEALKSDTEGLLMELKRDMKFVVRFQNDNLTIRDLSERMTELLNKLRKSYELLEVKDIDNSALGKALAFSRDFGGLSKKSSDKEAYDLYRAVFSNLNYQSILSLDLDPEFRVAERLVELNWAVYKSEDRSAATQFKTYQKFFDKTAHISILERITEDMFTPLKLQDELAKLIEKTETQVIQEAEANLSELKTYVLNYDNDSETEKTAPEYYLSLVDGILAKSSELDAEIGKYLTKGWSVGRLTRVERAILRLAAYEIQLTETPDVVAINEAVELAKDFSDEKSTKFINGVLTNFIKK